MRTPAFESALRAARYRVVKAGPYRVSSCANDSYLVERVTVHCAEHEVAQEGCEACAQAGLGVLARIALATDMALVLNARRAR